jgi:iron complex outermembrane receptor protein
MRHSQSPTTRSGACCRLLLTGFLLLGGSILTSVAVALEERVAVNLPPGSLQQALDGLAGSGQLQVLYDPAVVLGRSTPGVKGFMTRAQALERLLASTDVAFKFTGNDMVALYRKGYPSPDPPPHFVPAERLEHSVEAHTITVSANRSAPAGYAVDASLTAMKVDGPALVTPVAFQSLSAQTLHDQQAARLEDALENISSIESSPAGQSALGFNIRGFPTYQYYIDGVRVSPDLHHDGFRDLANVERVDVVKGPASTLYGRTEPGGLINIITKQPLSSPHFSVEQRAGGFNHRRTQLDAGGPLSSGGALRYRFNAAYESGDSYRELLTNRRVFLSPVVTWAVSPETQTTAYMEYLRSDDSTDAGLPTIGSSLPPVPAGRRVEDGGSVRTTDLRVGIRGLHSFSDRWTVRYHLDTRWLQTPQSPQLALADNGLDPSTCTPSQCLVDRILFAIPVSRGHTYFASMDLVGSTTLWGMRHALLIGTEYFEVQGRNEFLFGDGSGYPLDLFNPQHQPVPTAFLQNPDAAFGTRTVEQWNGGYFQDQVALTDRLSVVIGARYDHVFESLDTAYGFPLTDTGRDTRSDNAFKRRAAVLWHPTAPLSVYANYIENFGIATGLYSNGTGGTGSLLPPESAREWEVGLKAKFFEGRATASAAWYNLTEVNVAQLTLSPLLDAQGFRTVTGAARSRGLELDAQGAILPNLELMASYAYTESRIINDFGASVDAYGNPVPTPGNTGNRLYGVPRHGGSLWLAYRPDWSPARGLKLGVGVIARSERPGDNANDYQLPGFARWKALVAYGWRAGDTQLNVQLNVDNVFNTRYFESLSGTSSVMPGWPRRWLVSLRVEL